MRKFPLCLLLTLTFLKGLLWAGVTPIFQAPDEPLHYANIQYYSEQGQYLTKINTASKEIEQALKYLEFERIVFKVAEKQKFSKTINGIGEDKIKAIKVKEQQTVSKKVKLNSQNPPFYYFIGSFFYRLSPVKNLIWRVFLLRIYSIICFVLTGFFSYKAIELLFDKKNPLTYIIPTTISFLPMVNFISASINLDNLFMLLNTVLIYFIIKDFKKILSVGETFLLGGVAGLAFLTKQNFLPFLTIVPVFLFLNKLVIKKQIDFKRLLIFLMISLFISGIFYFREPIFREFILKLPYNVIVGRSPYEDFKKYRNYRIQPFSYSFYLQRFFHHQQPKKIFNYFWGTFGWVDTRLPRLVYYLILGFCLLSLLGFLKYLWKIKNEWRKNLWVWELLALIIFFAYSLSYYEWRFYQIYEDFFLQGRYFFPLIVPIMIFLVLGWQNLFPKKWQNKALFILSLLMIIFNFYCLFFIMIPRYYDTGNLVQLVNELSQYKPIFLKGVAWPILLAVYFFLTGILINNLYKIIWRAKENKSV